MKKVRIFEDFSGFKSLFDVKSFESRGHVSAGVSMSENVTLLKELETELKGNAGQVRELAYATICGESGHKFDNVPYNRGSDVNAGHRHISVKSSKFTLMSGSLCEGRTSFDAIWNLYSMKVASNEWTYITKDGTAYEMNKDEFKSFVYEFCGLEKESAKNGGAYKIRCKAESKKMLQWLEARVA